MEWQPQFEAEMVSYGVECFDLNGDRVLDPVYVDPDRRGPAVVVSLGRTDGAPEVEGRYPIVEGTGGPVIGGDVDGDGDTDLVVLHVSGGVSVLLNRLHQGGTAVAEVDATARPGRYVLGAAYPNPFNPMTWIPLRVPGQGQPVQLAVVDLLGQPVRTLVAGPLSAGRHVVPWDGRDDCRRSVAAGAYLVRLRAENWQRSGKLVKVD